MNKETKEKSKVNNNDKNDTIQKIILIIIIIILLLLFWLFGYRVGKIGYKTQEAVGGTVIDKNNEQIDIIKVKQDDIDIVKNTNINIFQNEKFNGEKIIAPKSKGSCQFCIENISDEDIIYNIDFFDEMEHEVNMKYRLKIDNVYVRGNQDEYVDIFELSISEVTVLKNSNNIFTLEWYWEDDDYSDTIVGSIEKDEYYTLNVEIGATKLIK